MTPDPLDDEPSPLRDWFLEQQKTWRAQFAQPRFRLVLQAVILGCLLIILAVIFLLGAQLRYEVIASEAFRQREYELAAQRFLRAAQLSTFFGKERNLYQVGLCYYNLKEYDRSADFFMQLFREHAESDWHEAARSQWENIVEQTMGPTVVIDKSQATTALSKAYVEARALQKKLVEEIRAVKAGDVRKLEGLWEQYEKSWLAYNKELKDAYAEAARTGPPNEVQAGKKQLEEQAPLQN